MVLFTCENTKILWIWQRPCSVVQLDEFATCVLPGTLEPLLFLTFRATTYMCCFVDTVHLKGANISINHQRRSDHLHFLVKISTLKCHYLLLQPLQPGSTCSLNRGYLNPILSSKVSLLVLLVVHSMISWLNTNHKTKPRISKIACHWFQPCSLRLLPKSRWSETHRNPNSWLIKVKTSIPPQNLIEQKEAICRNSSVLLVKSPYLLVKDS